MTSVTRAPLGALIPGGPGATRTHSGLSSVRLASVRLASVRLASVRLASARRLTLVAVALVVAASAVAGMPGRASAMTTTGSDMAALILRTLNADRTAQGLVPLKTWGVLTSLAEVRAQRMANANVLSHTAAGGDIGRALDASGTQWYSFGETIGVSGYPWGSESAMNIYGLWKGSGPHHAILFSTTFNYIGIGVIEDAKGQTWISAVLTESVDHTAPIATNRSLTRSGHDITFRWTGRDVLLQSHTAGLRSFDVQLRVDNGLWKTVRNDITWTTATFRGRASHHWYSVRVQAADRRGTLSRWTTALRIWVP